jgi:dTDP-glucose 4,6-dehydratase
LTLLQGNIEDLRSLPWGHKVTHILHAAADSTVGPSLSPIERFDQIVNGTRNLLEFAVQKGVSRFLLTSSGAVYGPLPSGARGISEDCLGMPDPLAARNAYGVAKRAAEHLCALYADRYGLETVVARCFAFVGRDLPVDAHFAIGNFVRDALGDAEIVVQGDGSPLRSYLDQRDLARWLLTMLETAPAGRAYNVGSDQAVTVSDLAHLVRDLVAPGRPVRILGGLHDGGGRSVYVPDITRARDELGLEVSIGLPRAIVDMAHALQGRLS